MSVVAFRDSIPPNEPNPDLVAEIEYLLEQAKSGHLRSLAYATTVMGNRSGVGWEGSDGSLFPLAASIMMLHHRYTEAMLQGGVE